ncbi:DNA modification system-associated small protein [Sphingobacterium sp. NPDC055346]
MKIKDNKTHQKERLKEICSTKGVDYNSLESMLDSVKSKKIKRINYHQQKIVDVIEKAII